MNDINQEQEGDSVAVCGTEGIKLCAHPNCNTEFEEYRTKIYCSTDCKNSHAAIIRQLGKGVANRGTIHAALLENSPRLQRVARFLSDGKPYSTREIIKECDVCAVNVIVGELRDPKNGFDIECTREGGIWSYKMVGGQSQLLRIV